ncbi:MAG: sporulation peptidase YabG [bacterium]|nr:sporulation peptidase YabG [bacterium]
MLFNIGDLVTRTSHNNDTIFKIIDIKNNIAILKGVNIRLIADSDINDLNPVKKDEADITKDDRTLINNMEEFINLNRDEYFYLPGKILHIDADKDYLERCMNFYKEMNVLSYGVVEKESDVSSKVINYLEKISPDILVITGHDAFYNKTDDYNDNSNYKNSTNFINAVKAARGYEKDHGKLIIIAGACQSNYEELIKAGSNFASSPKRINIHALDPAIIATSVSLSSKSKDIDLLKILEKTKYGTDGVGGIITSGTMYIGYPR